MKEKLTPFLKNLSQNNPAIYKQYYAEDEAKDWLYNDPLVEDGHEVVRGLVHKYKNRALIKVSYLCAAHCRFCTRIRQIGDIKGTLNQQNITDIVYYLNQHPEIDDVILSGGDPFYTPQITNLILTELNKIDSVKVVRIGTRLPFHSPSSFQTKSILNLLDAVAKVAVKKPFYVLLHIEHPSELTEETEKVIRQLKSYNITLLSQTVFLKDINDDFDTLYALFKRIYHLGVIPYYLYHCDRVIGLEKFYGDINQEKEIAVQLRKELSGIGCPLFVEDIEFGYGKIPVV